MRTSPEVVASVVVRIEMVVVLPAPFWPKQREELALLDRERDPVNGIVLGASYTAW